jgi:probable phosphoglycerate mutase
LNTAPQVHPLLIDLNNGIAAGKTHEEARQHAIPASEPIVDWQPYPQAESWRQFFTRISQFMDEFYAQRRETTLLVTHSAPG